MKKIDLDFTSLLDIMLILLFVFLLNSNAENLEKEEAAQAQIMQSRQETEKALDDLHLAKAENQLLQSETQKYKEQLDDMQKQMERFLSAPKQARQTWHNYQSIA